MECPLSEDKSNTYNITVENEAATEKLAKICAELLPCPLVISLSGNLGAGKTTFVRAVLRAWGYLGLVKSPTYTLLESYLVERRVPSEASLLSKSTNIHHFDLYRLGEPEEVYALGIEECVTDNSIVWIEWADKATDCLGELDLTICIHTVPNYKNHRQFEFKSHSVRSQIFIEKLENLMNS